MPIQLFVPTFEIEECLSEIRICLEKGWTGLGFKTVEFEERWKEYTGLSNAHFLCSATSGLELALRILKMQYRWNDGDEIITAPLTFVSTNHAILYSNLKPVFADVDEYLCMNPDDLIQKITPKTRCVIFVGMGGSVGQYSRIAEICKERRLCLILDAAHMSGTRINGIMPGSEADAVVYSFQAVKNLPTADSGMICLKEKDHDSICRKLTWLGINKDTYMRTQENGNYKWKYDVEYVGYKYHGNSIMAAIALVQLKYLDRDNLYRRQICSWYDELLSPISGIERIPVPYAAECSRHLYIIKAEHRDQLMLALNEAGIYPGVHYRDNTEYRMYQGKGDCPKARELSNQIMSLPLHLRLTQDDIHYISKTINNFIIR